MKKLVLFSFLLILVGTTIEPLREPCSLLFALILVGTPLKWIGSKIESVKAQPSNPKQQAAKPVNKGYLDKTEGELLVPAVWYPMTSSYDGAIKATGNYIRGYLVYSKDQIEFVNQNDSKILFTFKYSNSCFVLKNGVCLWSGKSYYFVVEDSSKLNEVSMFLRTIGAEKQKSLVNIHKSPEQERFITEKIIVEQKPISKSKDNYLYACSVSWYPKASLVNGKLQNRTVTHFGKFEVYKNYLLFKSSDLNEPLIFDNLKTLIALEDGYFSLTNIRSEFKNPIIEENFVFLAEYKSQFDLLKTFLKEICTKQFKIQMHNQEQITKVLDDGLEHGVKKNISQEQLLREMTSGKKSLSVNAIWYPHGFLRGREILKIGEGCK